ncbi:MAG TPA: KH domain-containing protein [Sandaracinaceae bacterium LLY-WYZ-13_1]|nr:KH domain-containing protein [Sandaracinaceae bacterium LLY-WYZ-13_1]
MDERDRDEGPLDGALLVDEGAHEPLDDEDEEDGKAEYAKEILEGIVERMGLDTEVSIREDDERVVLDVSGEDAGRAIGKKGQTLDALQFLVNKVVNRFPDNRRYVVVDSGDYRDRHDKSLVSMARREAKRAVEQGRTITLSPMPARDRRLIHLSLAKFPGVTTRSNGEGIGRRIQIIPSRGSRGGGGRRRRR